MNRQTNKYKPTQQEKERKKKIWESLYPLQLLVMKED
jgi:hypothetical protein